jgi:hypothetical protein
MQSAFQVKTLLGAAVEEKRERKRIPDYAA